jgi:hypothetical protein
MQFDAFLPGERSSLAVCDACGPRAAATPPAAVVAPTFYKPAAGHRPVYGHYALPSVPGCSARLQQQQTAAAARPAVPSLRAAPRRRQQQQASRRRLSALVPVDRPCPALEVVPDGTINVEAEILDDVDSK